MSDLEKVLYTAIETAFNGKYSFFEKSLDSALSDLEKKGYNVSYDEEEEGDWIAEGKYQLLEDAVMKIVIEDETFYLGVNQSRSGSPFSSYEYNEAEIGFLYTKEVYHAPTKVNDFLFNGKTIDIMSDKSGRVGDVAFKTVEDAIKSLI